jgi:hypothetical protein
MSGWIVRLSSVLLGRRLRAWEQRFPRPAPKSLDNVLLVPPENADSVTDRMESSVDTADKVYLRTSYLDHILGTDADRN